jgi:hypothetical protein
MSEKFNKPGTKVRSCQVYHGIVDVDVDRLFCIIYTENIQIFHLEFDLHWLARIFHRSHILLVILKQLLKDSDLAGQSYFC